MTRLFVRFLPMLFILLAIVISIALVMSKEKPQRKPKAAKIPVVQIMEAILSDPTFNVQSQGVVSPKHITLLSSQVNGRVDWKSDVFIEGGMFKQGDVLIQLEKDDYVTDVKQAEAELARATAALQEERARGKVAEVEWNTIKKSIAPELGLRKPQLAKEEANVKAAEAVLERARRNLKRTAVLAPFDGIVKTQNVEVGQFVGVGVQLGTLFDTNVAQIRLPLKQSDFAYLNLDKSDSVSGSRVTLTATVAGRMKTWQAVITRDEGLIDDTSRVMFAVAEIPDPYRLKQDGSVLKFGTFVSASIVGKQAKKVAVVPRSALRLDNTVVLVDSSDKLMTIPVEVAMTDGSEVWISQGIAEGDRLVVSSLANPKNGTLVSVSGPTNKTNVVTNSADSSQDEAVQ